MECRGDKVKGDGKSVIYEMCLKEIILKRNKLSLTNNIKSKYTEYTYYYICLTGNCLLKISSPVQAKSPN